MAGYPSIDGMVTVVFITTYHKAYCAGHDNVNQRCITSL